MVRFDLFSDIRTALRSVNLSAGLTQAYAEFRATQVGNVRYELVDGALCVARAALLH